MFSQIELDAFQSLKEKLLQSPILSIYNSNFEIKRHCDASSIGFGTILLQRQSDIKFRPIVYFSKRTTDVESRCHSFELETLAIIYALRRFRICLLGIKFNIVTDCQTLVPKANKKLVNIRMHRWSFELQSYDYVIEHRSSNRMEHVDVLSRNYGIFMVSNDSFEFALTAAQSRNAIIANIAVNLEIN